MPPARRLSRFYMQQAVFSSWSSRPLERRSDFPMFEVLMIGIGVARFAAAALYVAACERL
jgi:hypothetical protein